MKLALAKKVAGDLLVAVGLAEEADGADTKLPAFYRLRPTEIFYLNLKDLIKIDNRAPLEILPARRGSAVFCYLLDWRNAVRRLGRQVDG